MSIGLTTACRRAGLDSPEALCDFLLQSGARGVVVDDSMGGDFLRALRSRLHHHREALPLWAVENVCPVSRAAAAELGALERDEAQAAVDAAAQTISLLGELASELGPPAGLPSEGGPLLLLRLGEVVGARGLWPAVRRAHLRDELSGSALAEDLRRSRAAHAARHLDSLRRSLAALSRIAEDAGVRLGLRNPARYLGLPAPLELGLLLAELDGAPVAPVLDLAAAHLAEAMELRPMAEVVEAWKAAPMVLVADACGPLVGLPPGRGELDLPALLGGLPAGGARVLWAGAGLSEAELLEGMAALRALGA